MVKLRSHGPSLAAFTATGAAGFMIDAGVMSALVDALNWHPVKSRAVSFPLAVTTTWLLNRRFAFRGRGTTNRSAEYLGYAVVQALGALLNVGVFLICLELWPRLAAMPVVPLTIGALAGLLFNFTLLRGVVYRRSMADVISDGGKGRMSSAYSGLDNLEVMAEAVRYNAFLVDRLRAQVPPAGAVMDFGAGSGTFAVPLHREGVAVTCVEPDESLCRRLEEQGLAATRCLDGLPKAAFALIYSFNVLEHIDDDLGTLEKLKAYLTPHGILLLYVPAFQLLYSTMDRRVGHFRRYRRSRLVQLLERAGYSVEKARYADSLGFVAALVYRVLGSDDGSINRRALAFYDRWVFPVSVLLDRVVGRWFGKNVIVLARVRP